MSDNRKRIIKGVKFFLRYIGGLAPTIWKKCYILTVIWYKKLAPTRRKCFIAANASVHSLPTPTGPTKYATRMETRPQVSLKHDHFYARAWECEYEKPFFDAEKDK